jgi:hypothetical protein
LSGGHLQPGSDAQDAKFFPLDALPENMAFPTDLLICEKLKRLLANKDKGVKIMCKEYSKYLYG